MSFKNAVPRLEQINSDLKKHFYTSSTTTKSTSPEGTQQKSTKTNIIDGEGQKTTQTTTLNKQGKGTKCTEKTTIHNGVAVNTNQSCERVKPQYAKRQQNAQRQQNAKRQPKNTVTTNDGVLSPIQVPNE